MQLNPLKKADMPKAPSIFKLMGPSFVLLGLGLGSGEIILWPNLASRYGLGIIWAAILGISFQFFINMEIERYTLATGESVFVGLARIFKLFSPLWFILSTLIPWMWPGIIASCAQLISYAIGISYSRFYAIALILFIGILLSFARLIYKFQEVFQKTIIYLGVPFIFILAVLLVKYGTVPALAAGLIGIGDGYRFLPEGISIASFLGAIAYAGAGGNLNLVQSFYIKEKGYGMGKFTKKLRGLFSKDEKADILEGSIFENTPQNLTLFKRWWKKINLEHFLVFWLTGSISIIMLCLLAYSTVFSSNALPEGLSFILLEAQSIGSQTIPVISLLFLVALAVMLFSTQLSVMDATSRILSENTIISNQERFQIKYRKKYYFIFLWTQILIGIFILLFDKAQPLSLVIIGAVLNAFTMFIYSILLLVLNRKLPYKQIRPNWFRSLAILGAFLFYGVFSVITIIQYL